MKQATRRILKPLPRLSSVATLVKLAEQGAAGRKWYTDAKQQIIEAARILDVTPWYYADILSLFSPRVSVLRNIRLANHYIGVGSFHPTVMRGVKAAVLHYEATGEIRGPKTGAFARALLGVTDAVVLDVWMAKAFGCEQRQFTRPAVYSICEQRIRKAATILGWTPCEVQAAVWTATVRQANRNPAQFVIVRRTLYGPQLEVASV